MRVLALIALGGCATSSAVEAPRSAAADPHIDQITHGLLPPVQVRGEDVRFSIEDRMRKYKIHGVSVAVVDHYRVVWAKGFGVADVETGAPVTDTTVFLAGSISKSVNALAQLQAVAEGKLALDAPINDALTRWKLADNELTRGAPVTLRRLLSHTAGTNVHGFDGYVAGTPFPTLVQVLDGAPPANSPKIVVDGVPGKAYRYSGGGISITQLALVDRLGRPYPELLASRVLGPLGMTHSTYEQPLPAALVGHAAAGYARDGSVVPGKRNVYPEMAAAGLWTTPTDLARFFLELQLARAGRSDKISQAFAREMTTAVAPTDGGGQIGLGVFLSERNGAPVFGHSGADTGFQADAVASLDQGYGVFVMASSDDSFPLFGEIERAVFAAYAWPGADTPSERFAIDPASLARVAGSYGPADKPLVLAVAGGKLTVRQPYGEPVELVPVAAETYVALDGSGRYKLDGATFTRTRGAEHEDRVRLSDTTRAPLIELEAGRFDAAVAAARELVRGDAKAFDEHWLNRFAYSVLTSRGATVALPMFRLNAAVFPASCNVHESLAEALEAVGDKPGAIASYEAALAALPNDTTTPGELKDRDREASVAALARLRAK